MVADGGPVILILGIAAYAIVGLGVAFKRKRDIFKKYGQHESWANLAVPGVLWPLIPVIALHAYVMTYVMPLRRERYRRRLLRGGETPQMAEIFVSRRYPKPFKPNPNYETTRNPQA